MKKLLVLVLSVIAAFAAMLSLTACEAKVDKDGNVTITDGDKSNDNNNGGSSGSGSGSQGENDGSSDNNGSRDDKGDESDGKDDKGDETPEHSHTFNKQVAEEKYLKSAATCTAKATYYYSCECGEKGTQTFEYGDKLPHMYVDVNPYDPEYLKTPATCTHGAIYYKLCRCGAKSETETFEFGKPLPHEFDNSYTCTNCSYKCKSNGLTFELSTDNNSYACTGLGTFDGKILIIPAEYNGKPVTKIEEDAFLNATDITDVLIPDSVTEVGFNAFGGCENIVKMVLPFAGAYADGSREKYFGYIFGGSSASSNSRLVPISLKSIVLTEGVSNIENEAFRGCFALESITIPDGVTSIGDYAFYNCGSLKTITIPDGVTRIGDRAFGSCSKLTNITIPDGVTSIGYEAFSNCDSLTSITIPDSVTRVGKEAFAYCYNLTYSKYENGFYLGNAANKYVVLVRPKTWEIKTITINDECKVIADYAFYNSPQYLRSLESVVIGDGVVHIGECAFSKCTSLKSVTIGKGVKSIGDRAFERYGSLTKIYYNGDVNDWVQIEGLRGLLGHESTSDKELYIKGDLLTEAVIDKATKINDNAFSKVVSLKSVTIGGNVTSIGDYAFRSCDSLTNITILDGVNSIGNCAFEFNKSLTSVTIKGCVTSMGKSAFGYCNSLTSVTIGDSVTSISDSAFYNCYKLVEVINNSSLDIEKGGFGNGYVARYALSVKNGGESDIKNQGEYQFITVDGVNYLINYVGTDTEITLPANYNGQNYVINDHAFDNCDSLTSVTVGDGVTSIGQWAFDDCDSLTSVTIGDSVASIGNSAFYNCTLLMSITIPDSVTSIGRNAFYNCESLETINYKGTEKQWDLIKKDSNWNFNAGNRTLTKKYTLKYNYVEE